MDFDEIPLDADEPATTKPVTEERAEEIAEILVETGRILAEIIAEMNG